MHCTVAELQDRMDSREFADWIAYNRIEPLTPDRDDYHAALISATIANVFASKGRHYIPRDFMPDYRRTRLLTKTEDMIRYSMLLASI